MSKFLSPIFSVVIMIFLIACTETKPIVENNDDVRPEADMMPIQHTGIVTMAFKKDGCEVLIKMTSESDFKYLIPLQLDTKYKKEGLELKFNFVPSRAPQGDCAKGQMAALEDVGYAE